MKETAILKIVLALLFLICLADMPYGYFQLVRFIGMLGFAYLAYQAYETEQSPWVIFYGASALLINPFFKIALGRELWNIIDVFWAVVLIGTLLWEKRKEAEA